MGEDFMIFGKRLAALRKEAGITQKQLCAFLKMGDSAISSYEIGKSMPDYELLIEIAKYFNLSGSNSPPLGAFRSMSLPLNTPPLAAGKFICFHRLFARADKRKNPA
jgi:transcriptional regulator with XRE-family HTH domain